MKLFSLFYIVFIVACHTTSRPEQNVSVIHIDPDREDTLKMSDYFKKVDVVAFNSLYPIKDFYEIGDHYLVQLGQLIGEDEFCIFDKEGNELYEIGKFGRGPGEHLGSANGLQFRKDSTLHIIDDIKYLIYS